MFGGDPSRDQGTGHTPWPAGDQRILIGGDQLEDLVGGEPGHGQHIGQSQVQIAIPITAGAK
ncbi:MAG: hypothetical protein ACYDC9_00270 [Dermatophilaceae bacterium]